MFSIGNFFLLNVWWERECAIEHSRPPFRSTPLGASGAAAALSSLSSFARSRPGFVDEGRQELLQQLYLVRTGGQAQFQVEPVCLLILLLLLYTLIQIDQRNPQDAQNRYFPLLQKGFAFQA